MDDVGPGMPESKYAVVLFSGGLDSTAALFWAAKEFDELHVIVFSYGQRHDCEVLAAQQALEKIAPQEVKKYLVWDVDFTPLGSQTLLDKAIALPRRTEEEMVGLAPTYLPGRNLVMISLAASYAIAYEIPNIVGGWNAVDAGGYPDCQREFLDVLAAAINAGTPADLEGILIHAPCLQLDKEGIIELGIACGADFSYSVSCYDGSGARPCGECDACVLRVNGFKRAGREDPYLHRLTLEGSPT